MPNLLSVPVHLSTLPGQPEIPHSDPATPAGYPIERVLLWNREVPVTVLPGSRRHPDPTQILPDTGSDSGCRRDPVSPGADAFHTGTFSLPAGVSPFRYSPYHSHGLRTHDDTALPRCTGHYSIRFHKGKSRSPRHYIPLQDFHQNHPSAHRPAFAPAGRQQSLPDNYNRNGFFRNTDLLRPPVLGNSAPGRCPD